MEKAALIFPYLTSIILIAYVGHLFWNRRKVTSALAFVFISTSQIMMVLGFLVELLAETIDQKIFWDNFQLLWFTGWLCAFAFFVLNYTGRHSMVLKPKNFLLIVPLFAFPLFAFTDSLHHTVRANINLYIGEVFSYLIYDFSPFAHLFFIYFYFFFILLSSLLISNLKKSHGSIIFETVIIIVAGLIPILGSIITLTFLENSIYRDMTPITTVMSSIIVGVGVQWLGLFGNNNKVVNSVFDIMSDGVVLLDDVGRVTQINPSGQIMMGCNQNNKMSIDFEDLFGNWPVDIRAIMNNEQKEMVQVDTKVRIAKFQKYFHLTIQPLQRKIFRSMGGSIVVRDNTLLRSLEEELKKEKSARDLTEKGFQLLHEKFEERVASSTAELTQQVNILNKEIANRSKVEQELRKKTERYELVIRGSNDGFWDWDLVNNKFYYSDRWKSILGFSSKEVGTSPDEWFNRIHTDDIERVRRELKGHLSDLLPAFHNTHKVRNKKGEYIWILARGILVRDLTGKAIRMAGSFSDITELNSTKEQLQHLALHDTLTGLPNRALFLDRLNQLIQRAKRNITYQFATLYLDIDCFKTINDNMGHHMGDLLLQAIGKRLCSSLRSVDTIARLGGDEFIVLLDDVQNLKQVQQVADLIFCELIKPYNVDGVELVVSVSMGIVMGSEEYKRPEDILRDVDTAMYRAKKEGRGRYLIFSKQMSDKGANHLEMEIALRGAIIRNEFILNYQPILDVKTESVVGFEALVRWKHSEKGMVPPLDFIPLAEETGLIIPLGKWIFREACCQLKDWQLRFPGIQMNKMAINLSPKQFTEQGFINFVIKTLDETGVSPSDIYLEITESVLIDNPDIRFGLMQLRDCGLKIQIDDFGTGYSSLSYLHKLPIDALKIDKSFVTQLGTTVLAANGMTGPEIVRTIIQLAKTLNMHVVGEGVETRMQMHLLKELGCDYMQGFLFYKPMGPDMIETTLFNKRIHSITSPMNNHS